MGNCCNVCEGDRLERQQSKTLWTVLGINSVMFLVIVAAGLRGNSTSLLSDSLDNLGDAITYAISLFAVGSAVATKTRIALFKGGLIALAAITIMAEVLLRSFSPVLPSFQIMGAASVAGLIANGICLYLLSRHRRDDINMSSIWECSRNDIFVNSSVFLTAGLVYATRSAVPDLVVGFCLAGLLFRSSFTVVSSARSQLA